MAGKRLEENRGWVQDSDDLSFFGRMGSVSESTPSKFDE